MATVDEIQHTLKILREFYGKNGVPYDLNATQALVYTDGLVEFRAGELEKAARKCMRELKWFPALSELRAALLPPKADWPTLAQIAWTTFERAIGRIGLYRDARFEDAAIGHTVRQVFGSWEHACSYERDSPGWHGRRQMFLQLFPHIAQRDEFSAAITLRGMGDRRECMTVPHVASLPAPKVAAAQLEERGSEVLAEVERRFLALRGAK